MTILCSPKVTHHHADAVALLALGKRGSCPRANPCEPWPAALLRLMGFTSSRVSSRKLNGLRAFGADDGKAPPTPSARVFLPLPPLALRQRWNLVWVIFAERRRFPIG